MRVRFVLVTRARVVRKKRDFVLWLNKGMGEEGLPLDWLPSSATVPLAPSVLPTTDSVALPPPPPELALPLPPPPPAKPALTVGAKVGIAVGVVVVVGIVVGVLVYWLLHRSKSNGGGGSGGSGTTKFGTLTVTDPSSQTQSTNFLPGDQLKLQYTAGTNKFSGLSVWTFSSDGGATFPVTVAGPTSANTVMWTLPLNIFTQKAVFKVADQNQPEDFVATTTPITVDPGLTIVSGPGMTHATDSIVVNQSVTVVVATDTGLTGLTSSSFQVQLSADAQFKSGVSTATLQQVTLDTAAQRVTLVWTTATVAPQVWYRVSTTTLVASGYPYELTGTSNSQVAVEANPSCDGSSLTGNETFALCQMKMIETATGRSTNFLTGSAVTLVVAYAGTYPGSASFTYTGNTPWTVTYQSQTATQLTFSATLPSILSTDFVVTVQAGGQTLTSPTYAIVANLTIQLPSGSNTFVIPETCHPQFCVTTALTVEPASLAGNTWQVGWSATDGNTVAWFPVVSSSASGSSVSVVWCMTWANFGQTRSTGNQAGLLWFRVLDSGTTWVQQSTPTVTFDLIPPPPAYTCIVDSATRTSQSTFLLTGDVNWVWIFGDSATLPMGMVPDPAGTSAVYIVTQPDQTGATSYWGTIQSQQNITKDLPDAPNPVNYITLVNGTISTPPAGAQLFKLIASPRSGFMFQVVLPTPQTLYIGTANNNANLYGLYALNAGATPTSSSDFTWPGQVVPGG